MIGENITNIIINLENHDDYYATEGGVLGGSDEVYKFIYQVFRKDGTTTPLERVVLICNKDYQLSRKSVDGNLTNKLANATIILFETYVDSSY